ncbi:MAG: hypothetical protein F6J97_03450 [Leptolyngbya sp. SIO4C1]|nr:hypothetical protein [Leptolyngbya sp. SIO4C1]
MMQPTALLERSEQAKAEAKAIATIIEQALRPQGVRVKAKCSAGRLSLLLESRQTPSRQRLIPLVARQLARLQLDRRMQQIYIYGRRMGSRSVAWGAALRQSDTSASRSVRPLNVVSRRALGNAHADEDGFIEQTRLAIMQAIGCETVLVDVELEGSELLIALEAYLHPFDAKTYVRAIQQALTQVDLGNLKVAKLYYRHLKTQTMLPIKAIVLKR